MVSPYFIVSTDPGDRVIKDGPILWDGVTVLDVGPHRRLITVEEVNAGGYVMPPVEVAVLNAATVRTRAITAITSNRDYLDIPAPSQAQAAAQIKALTRQVTALIRLQLGQLDTDEGT